MRNGKKIKLTHANKIILITALGDYYYLQRANNTGWQETGYMILKVDSLSAGKKNSFHQWGNPSSKNSRKSAAKQEN